MSNLFRDLHANAAVDLDGISSDGAKEELTEAHDNEAKTVFIDVTGSAAYTSELEAAAKADGNNGKMQYTSDTHFTDVLKAAEQGGKVVLYTSDDDYVYNCPDLDKLSNVTVKQINPSKKSVKESIKNRESNVRESYRRVITIDKSLVDNELFVDFD